MITPISLTWIYIQNFSFVTSTLYDIISKICFSGENKIDLPSGRNSKIKTFENVHDTEHFLNADDHLATSGVPTDDGRIDRDRRQSWTHWWNSVRETIIALVTSSVHCANINEPPENSETAVESTFNALSVIKMKS
jgi:hypothetical protein